MEQFITKNSVSKRLKKELNDLSLQSDNLYLESIDTENCLVIITIKDIKINYIYKFYIPNNYPFHPPKIKINNYDYINFLKIDTTIFRKILKQLKGIHCLCCDSSVCNNKWKPYIKINNIIDEIRRFRQYKRDIINKFYADKIKKMYLIQNIDLDIYLFLPNSI
jgi:ubiquitin-protein ligase